jgi:hypothetical protein
MKMMELVSYADIQQHTSQLVFVGRQKEFQIGCLVMTKGNLVKNSCDSE